MLASVFVNPAEKPGGCPTRPAIYYVSSDLSSKEEGEGGGQEEEEGTGCQAAEEAIFQYYRDRSSGNKGDKRVQRYTTNEARA